MKAFIYMHFDTGKFDYHLIFLEPNDEQWMRPCAIDD